MGKSLNGNILKNYNGCFSFVKQKVLHDFEDNYFKTQILK